jgi:hypothetical protein
MYTVVAVNADPFLELDTPATFSNHADALRYAIDVAVVFHGAVGAPTEIIISGPDGPLEWSLKALLFTRGLRIA